MSAVASKADTWRTGNLYSTLVLRETLPEWREVCDYYPLLKQYPIFSPLFDGTYPKNA